jgi:hypothetical protein
MHSVAMVSQAKIPALKQEVLEISLVPDWILQKQCSYWLWSKRTSYATADGVTTGK